MPTFIPFEFPQTADGQFTAMIPDHRVLFYRRQQLGLTQQQVSDMAGVLLRQYQRIEQGDSDLAAFSLEKGLAICAALLLDPYGMYCPDCKQPDPATLAPMPMLDIKLPDEGPKKVGRKPIRRDVMNVYVNHPQCSILIPYEVLLTLGKPTCIQIMRNVEQKRILVRAVEEGAEAAIRNGDAFDVPDSVYRGKILAFPGHELIGNLRADMGWDDELYAVECRLVRDRAGERFILVDLKTALPSERIQGVLVIPECLEKYDDEEAFCDDEDDV